jgi:hypothetical protein
MIKIKVKVVIRIRMNSENSTMKIKMEEMMMIIIDDLCFRLKPPRISRLSFAELPFRQEWLVTLPVFRLLTPLCVAELYS